MMGEPISIAVIGASVLIGLVIASIAMLRGWREWLDLKRLELAAAGGSDVVRTPTAGRIEIADLKERVRKLEAIAAGIEL